MALEFTDANFGDEVLNSDTPVVVDFWAPWCGPCKMIAPIVEELASEYDGRVKVGKVNTDENQQISGQLGIMSIPTVMIFKNGEVVDRVIGAQPKDHFVGKIDAVLGS